MSTSIHGAGATAVAAQPKPILKDRPKPVLVTGAAGLVGMHVCRDLARRGWKVRALVRDPARAAARLASSRVEIIPGDIRDRAAVSSAMRGAGAVVHLAAIAIERRGERYEDVNTAATSVLLEAARSAGAERFLHMSQNFASSSSTHRFLRSKGIAEDLVRASDLEWTVLRPSVIFGPEDEFVNVLARLVRLSPVVYPLPGGGRARFQPIAVHDVAQAVGIALDRPATLRSGYALGGPAQLTLRQMVERILVAMDSKRIIVGVPVAALRPLIAMAQRVLPNPPVTTGLLDLLAVDNVVEGRALSDVFGIVPTPFAPEEIRYVKGITVKEALRSLFER